MGEGLAARGGGCSGSGGGDEESAGEGSEGEHSDGDGGSITSRVPVSTSPRLRPSNTHRATLPKAPTTDTPATEQARTTKKRLGWLLSIQDTTLK